MQELKTDPLEGMTGERWNGMSDNEREAIRDYSHLTPELEGLEGWRVEVQDEEGDKPRRFYVGRSTGWRPIHLEIARRNCYGGGPARSSYNIVRRLYRMDDRG